MRKFVVIACAAVLMTACGAKEQASTPAVGVVQQSSAPVPAATPTPAASSAPDPYAVYRANAPKGEPVISREDAAIRAKLGCGQKYAPGTVDDVLQKAYAAYC